jgi:hypothetical protein
VVVRRKACRHTPFAVAFGSGDYADLTKFDPEFLRVKLASGAVLDGFQTRERIPDLPGTRERSPKHLFRLYERFHLTLMLRHSDNRNVMGLERF